MKNKRTRRFPTAMQRAKSTLNILAISRMSPEGFDENERESWFAARDEWEQENTGYVGGGGWVWLGPDLVPQAGRLGAFKLWTDGGPRSGETQPAASIMMLDRAEKEYDDALEKERAAIEKDADEVVRMLRDERLGCPIWRHWKF